MAVVMMTWLTDCQGKTARARPQGIEKLAHSRLIVRCSICQNHRMPVQLLLTAGLACAHRKPTPQPEAAQLPLQCYATAATHQRFTTVQAKYRYSKASGMYSAPVCKEKRTYLESNSKAGLINNQSQHCRSR
jgi:hypothetical protein